MKGINQQDAERLCLNHYRGSLQSQVARGSFSKVGFRANKVFPMAWDPLVKYELYLRASEEDIKPALREAENRAAG